jgi:hypothetical protein
MKGLLISFVVTPAFWVVRMGSSRIVNQLPLEPGSFTAVAQVQILSMTPKVVWREIVALLGRSWTDRLLTILNSRKTALLCY